jgi:hypothetical protein
LIHWSVKNEKNDIHFIVLLLHSTMTQRTPRMIRFLEEVNTRYFNSDPQQLEQLFSLLDSISEEKSTCTVLFKSGIKKGTPCGKPCVSNQMCTTHLKKHKEDEPKKKDKEEKKKENTCEFPLKSGANKGKPCGKVRSDGCEWCSIHTKSKAAEKKKEEEEEPEEKITFCQAKLKNGSSCTSKSNGEQFCKTHTKSQAKTNHEEDSKHTLRVKRDGERYLIKGTNVMFDMTTQCIIGFKRGDDYVLEENEETKEMCERYKLSFE